MKPAAESCAIKWRTITSLVNPVAPHTCIDVNTILGYQNLAVWVQYVFQVEPAWWNCRSCETNGKWQQILPSSHFEVTTVFLHRVLNSLHRRVPVEISWFQYSLNCWKTSHASIHFRFAIHHNTAAHKGTKCYVDMYLTPRTPRRDQQVSLPPSVLRF